MIFYLILFAVLIFIYNANKDKSSLIILIILILLVCLRSQNVGTDTRGYIQLISSGGFNVGFDSFLDFISRLFSGGTSMQGTEFQTREITFSILITLLSTIGLEPFVVIKTLCVIVLLLYYKAIRATMSKTEISVALLLLLTSFLYFSSFNTLRQALAVALLFNAFVHYEKKQYPLFSFFLILAITTHNSAIFIIPFFFLYKVNIPSWLIGSMLVLVVLWDMAGIRLSFLNDLQMMMESEGALYSHIIESSFINSGNEAWYVRLLSVFFHIIVAFAIWRMYKCSDTQSKRFFNLVFFGIIFYILVSRTPIIARLAEYFLVFQLLWIPKLMTNNKPAIKKTNHLDESMPYVFAFSWYFYHLVANWEGMIPYEFGFSF